MKICGVIAEYNPFHEGHAYQLREARRLSGADALVVIMSGHFVQRGEPAITDPYARALDALRNGADAVFMMPPEASTASAEYFASYGVAALDALGCDFISCGVEIEGEGEISRLKEIAARMADEDETMGKMIRSALKSGDSYPAALAKAAGAERMGPNSILAIEYFKAMRRLQSSMDFVPVKRKGSGYNDTEVIEGMYPSATALRKEILYGNVTGAEYPIGPDDIMPMVIESIRNHADELESYADCTAQIAARIRNSGLHYRSFEEMVTDIKTKDLTYTRISRVLMHILLGIMHEDMQKALKSLRDISYAQLLGFNNREILTELSKRSAQKSEGSFTIISKAADHKDVLARSAYAAEVYNQALWNKYHVEGKDFFMQKIIKE